MSAVGGGDGGVAKEKKKVKKETPRSRQKAAKREEEDDAAYARSSSEEEEEEDEAWEEEEKGSSRKKTTVKATAKPRAPSKKKGAGGKPASTSSGVGALVMEKKKSASGGDKKRKKPADEEEEEEEEEGGSESDASAKKKKKKQQTTAKRGVSSVDSSKAHLSPQEALHERYMTLKVDQLRLILAANLMSLPRPPNKDTLAWFCVYGEVLGAPPCLCQRCGKGKLRPKVKKQDVGVKEVVKGQTKWTCAGFFDTETDSLVFCNKAYTDKELHAIPFKGIDAHVTAEDAAKARNKVDRLRAEADEELAAQSPSDADAASSRASSPIPLGGDSGAASPKKTFVHAKRLFDAEQMEERMARAAENAMRGDEASDEEGGGGEERAAKRKRVAGEAVADADAEMKAAGAEDPYAAFISAEYPSAVRISPKAADAASPAAVTASSKSPPPAAATVASDSRPPCKYGSACYRKNPDHIAAFSHARPPDASA